ncbi:MAG: GGDEF domain-containing protein [Sulfuritalea sp.]|nr:GGDEF domain-containing protein [Sulfuritalea sp.]MDP1983765.1 GGDEF domain-containing protein [Sulfuritalea sp.]
MKFRQSILWKPSGAIWGVTLLAGIVLTLLVGWVHYLTGNAYEFHVFFALPILVVAWFLGFRPALGVVVLAVGVWFAADWGLEEDQADPFPLLFNTAMRLAIFVTGAWTLAQMRHVLDREARLAREDTLTGLANRRAFHEQGRAALALASRQETPFTAVFIDLDKFKQVNDEQGHDTGDALLRRVAEAFRSHVRAGDIVGRLGGDEFALLLPGMGEQAALAYVNDLRQRLLDAMREHGWPVTFSVGIVSCHRAPDDLESLLNEADQLMYDAKEAGRDRILQHVPDEVAR